MDMQRGMLFTLIAIGAVHADTKTWNKDVNFHNEENWNRARVPCPSDTIIIPENSTSLFLQMDGSLKEVILPIRGEIVLGNDITVTFSDGDSTDQACSGQDITFTRKGPKSWLNPGNWDSESLIPIASDQVPCEYDNVQFPPDKRFSVSIEETIRAGSISINDQVLSGSLQAAAFLASPNGQSQFDLKEGASLNPSGLTCGDVTGCACGNNGEKVLEQICSFIRTCPDVSCEDPVKPVGACCPLCGAFLTLHYDESGTSFKFADLEAKLRSDYEVGSSSDGKVRRQADQIVVNMYMSKTAPGLVQVVLTDNGQGADEGRMASQLAEQIANDIERNPSAFGVLSSEVHFSARGDGGGFGMGGATAIIIVLVVGIILAVSIIYVMLRRHQVHFAPQFPWRKDEPLDADIEMNQKYREELPPPEVAFDNPMYNKPVQDTIYDDPAKGSNGSDSSVEDLGSIGEADGGFSNPMAVTPQ